MRKSELPVFGVLQGLKVIVNGSSAAGPVAGRLMADHGANVIWMESPKSPDGACMSTSAAEIERRNMRTICVYVPTPDGREIFKRLLADCDIYIENLKPGIHDKWGFTDEVMWEINPKLVIAHVSGFFTSFICYLLFHRSSFTCSFVSLHKAIENGTYG